MPQRGDVEITSSLVLEVGFAVVGAEVLGGAETGADVTGALVTGLAVGGRLVGAWVGFAVGLFVVEEVEDVVEVDVTGAFVIGLTVGDRLVGAFVGLLVVEVVVEVVDVVVTVAEQLAVLLTSPFTVVLQAPPTSCCATQKNAPPLHPNTPWL
jgi:hypothetical protein